MTSVSQLLGATASSDYFLTRMILQRSLAAIYFVAFLVAVNQFRPLLGTHGLTPAPFFIDNVRFTSSPSLFYLHYSDGFAMALAWSGLLCALLCVAGVTERLGTLPYVLIWGWMWLAYLSFVNVGQTWYGFGWETLLLEAGFLAIFLGSRSTATPIVVIWMYRWLVFRVMFGAGMIKLRGDPCWRDLTCLVYHYQTQPIPNLFSWFLNRSPVWLSKAGVLFNHLAEVVAPFGYLVPFANVRRAAGIITILFQGTIIVSGNLSWLNWLTIVIAIPCFDDAFFQKFMPPRDAVIQATALPYQIAIGLLVVTVVALSFRPALNLISSRQMMNASFEPLHLVNTYGAFGSVSRQRFEIVLEGTADSEPATSATWKEYEFKAKPGDVSRRPPFLAPYHRRLDWLMWFIPLDASSAGSWYPALVARLLQNDRPTLALMGKNPFPGAAPRWIRARSYEYTFTTAAERKATGNYWTRELVGEFMRPVSLQTRGFVEGLEQRGWRR